MPPPHVLRAHEAAGRDACVGDARSSILAAPRGGSGGPGAAAARPARAHEAAGRAACVGDARSCLFSLLFAAVAAAQVSPLHVQLAPMRLLGVHAACVGDARSCLLSLLFAAVAAAQVPPPHVQLASRRLRGVPLASVTLALLFSLLFAAVAAAQVQPLHVQLVPIRPLRWLRGRRALRRGARLLRRPRAGADARGVADTLLLAALYGDSGGAIGDTVSARRGGAYAAAQGARHCGASTAQAFRLGVSQCGLALRLQRGATARPPQRSTLDTSM